MKTCSSCGISLDEKYKFCPNCGAEYVDTVEEVNEEIAGAEVLLCDSCGEENEIGSSFCSACGVKLHDKNKVTVQPQTITKKEKVDLPVVETKKSTQSKQSSKKKKTKPESVPVMTQKKSNEPNKRTIIIAFAGILIVAVVILITSGVFSIGTTSATTESFQNVNQQPSSGIDLNSVSRINELAAQLKADPNNFDLRLQLAHLKNDAGFKDDAINLYKEYLDKFPNNADVLVDMGVCYFDLHRYDEAIPPMEKALKINPKHQIAEMNLGIVNLAKGNIEKSKEWLQKAVDLDPNSEIGRKAKQLLTSH